MRFHRRARRLSLIREHSFEYRTHDVRSKSSRDGPVVVKSIRIVVSTPQVGQRSVHLPRYRLHVTIQMHPVHPIHPSV